MDYKTILESIGNTPIIKLNFNTPATILAKLEYLNPSGSVKDRSALFMIEQAEKQGILKPGGTLIEASSGNQGIATAMIGASKGYKVIITTNKKFSQDKVKAITAYGAELVMCKVTEFVEDPESYHSIAKKIQEQTPNSFILDQYYNLANAQAHYTSLGPEIWRQTEGTLTHFFAATGTCGTTIGTGKYLKEQSQQLKVVGVDSMHSFRSTGGHPQPYKLEGVGVDFDAPILNNNKDIIDEFHTVNDKEAFDMLKTLAHQHGILVGPSSGAVAAAVATYTKNLTKDDIALMIFADSGRAYLNRNYYENEADDQNAFIPSESISEQLPVQ